MPHLGPQNGLKIGTHPRCLSFKFSVMGCSFSAQVHAFWTWADWLKQQAAQFGREPVFINLDETAVSKAHPDAIGMVVSKQWWPGPVRPQQKVPKKDLRSMVTHVGLCTHRTDLQARLPQIFIGNPYCFTSELVDHIAQVAPGKVKFWRRTSSWNSSKLMCTILLELALAVAGFPEVQPILVMGCAGIHLTTEVLRAASAFGIWILPVPARCTFLLQPCDTHVFSPYKAFLRNAYRRLKDASGQVSREACAQSLVDVATRFLCGRRWSDAFYETGLLGKRERLTRDLASVVVPPVPSAALMPTVTAVREVLPSSRRRPPYSLLLSEPRGSQMRRLFVL